MENILGNPVPAEYEQSLPNNPYVCPIGEENLGGTTTSIPKDVSLFKDITTDPKIDINKITYFGDDYTSFKENCCQRTGFCFGNENAPDAGGGGEIKEVICPQESCIPLIPGGESNTCSTIDNKDVCNSSVNSNGLPLCMWQREYRRLETRNDDQSDFSIMNTIEMEDKDCCISKDTCYESHFNRGIDCPEDYIYDTTSNNEQCRFWMGPYEMRDDVWDDHTEETQDSNNMRACDFNRQDRDVCCIKGIDEFFKLPCSEQVKAANGIWEDTTLEERLNIIHFDKLNNITNGKMEAFYKNNNQNAFIINADGGIECTDPNSTSTNFCRVDGEYNFVKGCSIGNDVNTTTREGDSGNTFLTVNELNNINSTNNVISKISDAPVTCSNNTTYNINHHYTGAGSTITNNPFINEENVIFNLHCDNPDEIIFKVIDESCSQGTSSDINCSDLNEDQCIINEGCIYNPPIFRCLPNLDRLPTF